MKTNPTVVEFAVGRLADLGIEHVFGVAGDYAFPIDGAIEANDRLSYIGCSNELNAAYSADGYARVHGAAILTTTYAVGESSALCGVIGSNASVSSSSGEVPTTFERTGADAIAFIKALGLKQVDLFGLLDRRPAVTIARHP